MKLTYKHLVQKQSLCGPTCLQMILLRRGVWVDQEVIAKEIGVKIPPSIKHVFTLPLEIGQEPKDYGVNLNDFASEEVKTLLKNNNIEANVKVYKVSEIENLHQFLSDNLEQGNDIIANFWMSYFSKDEQEGHYGLVSEIDGEQVTICDPWLYNKTYWQTTVEDLKKSMQASFDGNERGFAVFIKK